MKKVFISVPMSGRKAEDIVTSINKLHKVAEALAGEELEVISSYNPDFAGTDRPIECLGECIKLMQDADYFIQPGWVWHSKGCSVEKEVANQYKIPFLEIDSKSVCSDWYAEEFNREYDEECYNEEEN